LDLCEQLIGFSCEAARQQLLIEGGQLRVAALGNGRVGGVNEREVALGRQLERCA